VVPKVDFFVLVEESVVSQFNRRQSDQHNNDSLPKWVFDHLVGQNTDRIHLGEDVKGHRAFDANKQRLILSFMFLFFDDTLLFENLHDLVFV
jgi:hypothetical protein